MTTMTGSPTGKRDLLHHETISGIETATMIDVREGIKGVTVTTIDTGEETSCTLHGVDIPMVIEDLAHRQCPPHRSHRSHRGPSTHPRTTWRLDTARETTPLPRNILLPRLGSVSGERQADREGTVMLMTTSRAEAMAVQGRIGIMAVGRMTPMTAIIIEMIGAAEGIRMGIGEIEIVMRRLEGGIMIVINPRVPVDSRIVSVMYKKAVNGSRCNNDRHRLSQLFRPSASHFNKRPFKPILHFISGTCQEIINILV
jgi:hypothetical protein